MKRKYVVALVLLCCSLVLNTIFIVNSQVKSNTTPIITGTYICGEGETDPSYIVLTTEGDYYKYKQFDMQSSSKYVIDENGIICLEDNDSQNLICIEDKIYLFEDDATYVYSKKSNNPMFINVQEP